MKTPLLALTLSAFAIGTSEFVIVGLLPDLSHALGVSVPRAGVLVSAYALSVTFGSPLLALALRSVERRRALLTLMLLFTGGNVLCALAPAFGLLAGARVLTALCHGAFFGIGSIVAADLVPRAERARAVAMMFTGLTLANILGVPAGTALGQAFGWRFAFWALIPVGLLAALSLFRLLPVQPAPEPTRLRSEIRAVLQVPVQIVLALSTLSSVALFCVLTYIAPMLERVTHLSPHAVTPVLIVFGVGITLGNLAGGRLSDWSQLAVIAGGPVLLIAVFVGMFFALPYAPWAIGVVFLWGAIHFAAGSPLQVRIVEKAKGANLASTLNQSAFNFGNALGASLGGLLLTRGAGYVSLPLASAAVGCVSLLLAAVAVWSERRELRAVVTPIFQEEQQPG